ncbi:double zinc ribbon domain-containing protein [Thauera sp.]|jgi:hypothetical protein|uniref:double zinc ribbon domain-containing protein n=1 Tax=Thauera sp. TaxID=1905334 RepID=UPI002A3643C8|nr:zinc ribbon domain-containing protein [Thauera sp.]MDX9886069.1 zinc ribbon domain-containing protein [Thauera sp.]
MDIVHCSFCKHGNPADAKFCNACGSSLALQLCEACGAIDNVSAAVCHKCGQPFAPRSGVATPDEGEAQSVTPAAQTEKPARPKRSPWKLFALLALIVAGALVVYPRVAGDEAQLPAIHAPVAVEAEAEADSPPPDSPAGDATETAPSEAASETTDTALPPTDAAPSASATEPLEDAPAPPTEALDAAQVEPPSPTETTTESAQDESPAPSAATQPTQAPAADSAEPPAPNPQTAPAGCSPAIDALGLCK